VGSKKLAKILGESLTHASIKSFFLTSTKFHGTEFPRAGSPPHPLINKEAQIIFKQILPPPLEERSIIKFLSFLVRASSIDSNAALRKSSSLFGRKVWTFQMRNPLYLNSIKEPPAAVRTISRRVPSPFKGATIATGVSRSYE
jgi:hypothetical protein